MSSYKQVHCSKSYIGLGAFPPYLPFRTLIALIDRACPARPPSAGMEQTRNVARNIRFSNRANPTLYPLLIRSVPRLTEGNLKWPPLRKWMKECRPVIAHASGVAFRRIGSCSVTYAILSGTLCFSGFDGVFFSAGRVTHPRACVRVRWQRRGLMSCRGTFFSNSTGCVNEFADLEGG